MRFINWKQCINVINFFPLWSQWRSIALTEISWFKITGTTFFQRYFYHLHTTVLFPFQRTVTLSGVVLEAQQSLYSNGQQFYYSHSTKYDFQWKQLQRKFSSLEVQNFPIKGHWESISCDNSFYNVSTAWAIDLSNNMLQSPQGIIIISEFYLPFQTIACFNIARLPLVIT